MNKFYIIINFFPLVLPKHRAHIFLDCKKHRKPIDFWCFWLGESIKRRVSGGDTAGGPVTWCYDSGSESAVSFGTPVGMAQLREKNAGFVAESWRYQWYLSLLIIIH